MLQPINNHIAVELEDKPKEDTSIVLSVQCGMQDGFQTGCVTMAADECQHLLGRKVMIPVYDGISVVLEGRTYVLIQSSKVVAVIE